MQYEKPCGSYVNSSSGSCQTRPHHNLQPNIIAAQTHAQKRGGAAAPVLRPCQHHSVRYAYKVKKKCLQKSGTTLSVKRGASLSDLYLAFEQLLCRVAYRVPSKKRHKVVLSRGHPFLLINE